MVLCAVSCLVVGACFGLMVGVLLCARGQIKSNSMAYDRGFKDGGNQ